MICSYAIYFLQISVCAVSYVFFQLCGRPVQCLSLCLILALTLPSTKNMTQIFSCKVFIYESSMLEIKRFKQRATHQCSVSAFVCMILALPLQSTNYMMQMFSSKIRIKWHKRTCKRWKSKLDCQKDSWCMVNPVQCVWKIFVWVYKGIVCIANNF